MSEVAAACFPWFGIINGCTINSWPFLVFFPLFFVIWNFGCSQLILVPLLRWSWFGSHDAHARRAVKGLICPHWLIGIVMPVVMSGVVGLTIGVLLPYSYCTYKLNALCKAEAEHGLIMNIRNEVDIFVDGKKTLRVDSNTVRRSKNGLEFFVEGKNYNTIKVASRKANLTLQTDNLLIATAIFTFFTTKPTALQGRDYEKSYEFVNRHADGNQNIKLMYTAFVGNENIAVAEATILQESNLEQQSSWGDNIIRAMTGGAGTNTNQHFVATALYFQPVETGVNATIAPSINHNNRNDYQV